MRVFFFGTNGFRAKLQQVIRAFVPERYHRRVFLSVMASLRRRRVAGLTQLQFQRLGASFRRRFPGMAGDTWSRFDEMRRAGSASGGSRALVPYEAIRRGIKRMHI